MTTSTALHLDHDVIEVRARRQPTNIGDIRLVINDGSERTHYFVTLVDAADVFGSQARRRRVVQVGRTVRPSLGDDAVAVRAGEGDGR